jgi:inorganic triphosphatase YgiF
MANEIELKLEVAPAQLARLRGAPWLTRLADGPAIARRLESVYFDSDELALRDQRAILHVRKSEGAYTQTFKAQSQGADAALDDRFLESGGA